jgi:hypothetical protein
MARDYLAELLEIEKQRQANNEATRTEERTQRNRLEDAIKEFPEHEPVYRDEIGASRQREEDMVAANDKTAAAKAADVEAAQKAEEAQKSEPAVQLVEPPPPPANDNRATAFANLAAQEPEPAYPRKFDNAQDYQSALNDLNETALASSKEYDKALSKLNDAKEADAPDSERIAELQGKVDELDEQRKADHEAVADLQWANLEYDGAAPKPESLADRLPDREQVFNAAQMGFAAAGIAAQMANPLSLADRVDIQDAIRHSPAAIERVETVENLNKDTVTLDKLAESRSEDLEDAIEAMGDIHDIEKEADIQRGVEGAKATNEAFANARDGASPTPADHAPSPSGGAAAPGREAEPAVVARVEMRQPTHVTATASNVELQLMPAPPPPPPPPPPLANDNTLGI